MKLFKRRKTYPSLIISEEKVQVLYLDKSGKKVISLAEVKLDKSVVSAGEVKDQEKLILALRQLFQAAKINERSVVVGIPENKSYTKVINLPKLKAEELTEAVTWEAETYLPVPLEQVYMDWKVISDEKKDEISILLIAVPKEIIDGYTHTLKKAGFSPLAYETTALSLVRLIESQEIRALVIEIGLQYAVLTLSKGKAIEASSIVSLREEGHDISFLVQTINKMLKFYNEKRDDKQKVAAIFICGEGLIQSHLEEITKGTNHAVKLCPIPVKNLPANKEQNFAIVASLAMKSIEAPIDEHTINLLPPTIQEEFDQVKRRKANKLLLTFSTIIISLITLSSLVVLLYFSSTRNSLESQKLSMPLPPTEISSAVKATNSLNYSSKLIVKIGSQRVFPHKRLDQILQSLQSGVRIINISINENQKSLRIVGQAQTRADLLQFKDNLESKEDISNAILPLSVLQQSENINFMLSAALK